ncbi:MAG: hypothetical protein K2X27_13750 [Candidatus Obscuribacterales bacterium]|nr:hypothetical protein [Candidatus Obscuribacterales bacterium]
MRNTQGGALSMVVVSTITLIMIGVGFFYLMKLMGGQRELQNAADSGTLSVAKIGVKTPTVDIISKIPAQRSPFEGLIDAQTKGINLQSYNRAVGQAFLVALNAEADGSAEGIRNAKQLIKSLQGTQSIGSDLADKLSNPGSSDDSWVAQSFLPLAKSNSLRMLANADSSANLDYKVKSNTYAVSYVRPEPTSLGQSCTNIELNQNFSKQVPYTNYTHNRQLQIPKNAIASDKTNKYRSLRGYDPIKIGRVGNICAVSMSPYEQPHLVSNKTFSANTVSPTAQLGLVLPPNSFQTSISVKDQKSSLNLDMTTSSLVGTSALNAPLSKDEANSLQLSATSSKYDIAIPRGYLIIDNCGNEQNTDYTDLLPQPNTKTAEWYGTATGVSVDKTSGYFSNNGRLEEWLNYNYAKNQPGGAFLKEPSVDGLYTQKGEAANIVQARQIPGQKEPSPCHCNDLNSDPKSPKTFVPICGEYATSTPPPLGHQGQFDKAYFPGYLNPPLYGKAGSPLTAGELSKMKLWNLYLSQGIGGIYLRNKELITGARVYPHAPEFPANDPLFNMPTPYNPPPGSPSSLGVSTSPAALAYSNPVVPGQVTRDGSVLELMQQVASHSVTPLAALDLKRFLENRMWQIKPDATQAEIDTVLMLKKIKIGKRYYIYLNAKRQFELSTDRPFWINDQGSDPSPDGSPQKPIKTLPFCLLGSLVNTSADFNIHEVPFIDYEPQVPTIFGYLSASFTPSSGANNLLGVVKFSETSLPALQLFSNAN